MNSNFAYRAVRMIGSLAVVGTLLAVLPFTLAEEKLADPIPRDCGSVPLEGPTAGALACSAECAPAAALGSAARAAPPAVDEAADEELEPRLRWLSP